MKLSFRVALDALVERARRPWRGPDAGLEDVAREALLAETALDEIARVVVPRLRYAATRAYLAGEREESVQLHRAARALDAVYGPIDHPAEDAPRLPLVVRPPVLRLVRGVELVDLVDEGGEP